MTPARRAAREAGLAVLRRAGLLESTPEPEFDRWTDALRCETGAAVAALSLVAPSRSFLKSYSTAPDAGRESSPDRPRSVTLQRRCCSSTSMDSRT